MQIVISSVSATTSSTATSAAAVVIARLFFLTLTTACNAGHHKTITSVLEESGLVGRSLKNLASLILLLFCDTKANDFALKSRSRRDHAAAMSIINRLVERCKRRRPPLQPGRSSSRRT